MNRISCISFFLPVLVWAAAIGQPAAADDLKQNLDLPFDAGGADLEEESGTNLITFYGQQYEGDGVFYCLDRSSSMKDQGELDILKREVLRNLLEFAQAVQFGIVFFSSDTVKFPDTGLPVEATSGMKGSAQAFLNCINAGGATCAARGLMEALRMANASTAKRSMILFLTDGNLYCRGMESEAYKAKTLEDVTRGNYKQVPIHCIAIGGDVDVEFLLQLSRANNGTYRQINR